MIDLIKKGIFTSIGVVALTKDRVEDLAKELAEKSRMSEAEGEKLVQEILARSEESRMALQAQIDKMIEAAVERMQLAKSADVEALQAEIAQLKSQLAQLEKQQ